MQHNYLMFIELHDNKCWQGKICAIHPAVSDIIQVCSAMKYQQPQLRHFS